jgi:hypothetical protein
MIDNAVTQHSEQSMAIFGKWALSRKARVTNHAYCENAALAGTWQ